MTDTSASLPVLPHRPEDGHKGTFGTVCILGGRADDQRIMVGGPAFAALAALRSGCGLAVLAVPTPIMAAALVIAPSATGLALPVDDAGALRPSEVAQLLDEHIRSFQCLAIGPGLGAHLAQQQVVVRLVAQDAVPMVIDADAINCLSMLRDMHRDFRARAVLTPHPGEFERLAKALGVPFDSASAAADDDRQKAASAVAQRLGCIIVLKGRRTVITDGMTAHINATGNVALASAGTGDVLTGIIAGFIAQFFGPMSKHSSRPAASTLQHTESTRRLSLLECARLATHVHGLAADAWAAQHGYSSGEWRGTVGMLASDLLAAIPGAVNLLQRENK